MAQMAIDEAKYLTIILHRAEPEVGPRIDPVDDVGSCDITKLTNVKHKIKSGLK